MRISSMSAVSRKSFMGCSWAGAERTIVRGEPSTASGAVGEPSHEGDDRPIAERAAPSRRASVPCVPERRLTRAPPPARARRWPAPCRAPWSRPPPPRPSVAAVGLAPGGPARGRRAAPSAVATNPSKSGCGRSGRLLNSGWNWLATNQGWSRSSTISTRRPSGDWPERIIPAPSSIAAVAVVHLEAVAMPLVDDLVAVDRVRPSSPASGAPGRARGASCRPCPRGRAGRA